MKNLVDLDRYPLDQPGTLAWQTMVQSARDTLARDGLFNLEGFLRADAIAAVRAHVTPRLQNEAFRHARMHNIYFKDHVAGLPLDHPALYKLETVNHTLCTDQLADTGLVDLYQSDHFARFLAAVMDKTALFPMDDPISGVNVMGYHAGDALNWHFDRSEFTTTILLQATENGGVFEYAKDLRSATDPNYDGVAELLDGRKQPTALHLNAGTLNVFRGKNTAHRVTRVQGPIPRIICVLSYFETPGVAFSDQERIGFYGRAR